MLSAGGKSNDLKRTARFSIWNDFGKNDKYFERFWNGELYSRRQCYRPGRSRDVTWLYITSQCVRVRARLRSPVALITITIIKCSFRRVLCQRRYRKTARDLSSVSFLTIPTTDLKSVREKRSLFRPVIDDCASPTTDLKSVRKRCRRPFEENDRVTSRTRSYSYRSFSRIVRTLGFFSRSVRLS